MPIGKTILRDESWGIMYLIIGQNWPPILFDKGTPSIPMAILTSLTLVGVYFKIAEDNPKWWYIPGITICMLWQIFFGVDKRVLLSTGKSLKHLWFFNPFSNSFKAVGEILKLRAHDVKKFFKEKSCWMIEHSPTLSYRISDTSSKQVLEEQVLNNIVSGILIIGEDTAIGNNTSNTWFNDSLLSLELINGETSWKISLDLP